MQCRISQIGFFREPVKRNTLLFKQLCQHWFDHQGVHITDYRALANTRSRICILSNCHNFSCLYSVMRLCLSCRETTQKWRGGGENHQSEFRESVLWGVSGRGYTK